MKKNRQASNNEDLNRHMFSRSHRRILDWFLSVQSVVIKKTRILYKKVHLKHWTNDYKDRHNGFYKTLQYSTI